MPNKMTCNCGEETVSYERIRPNGRCSARALDVIHSTLMSTTCVNSDPRKSASATAEE